MNKSLLELFQKVTLYDLMWSFALIIAIAFIIIPQKKKISKSMNKWRKNKNNEESFDKLVYELNDMVIDMQKTMNDQSKEIKNLTNIVIDMQKRNSKTKRAEIKERIERIYRECHPAMTCTNMQFETLKELIEEYEEHGGNNSFIHSVVEPEMFEWEVITEIKEV